MFYKTVFTFSYSPRILSNSLQQTPKVSEERDFGFNYISETICRRQGVSMNRGLFNGRDNFCLFLIGSKCFPNEISARCSRE